MTTPTVSIITPTYNRSQLLGETVESILGQTFSDFEYIIVDDGSTDDTGDMLRAIGDPRLKLFEQSNQGEVSATNRGWSAARGRYIAIVSSDDPMQPFWLKELVAALDRDPDAVVAYPDWALLDEEGSVQQIVRTPEYRLYDMAASFKAPAGPGALIRKSCADRLAQPRRPEFRYCADLDMWLRLALFGHFVRVPKVLASWRDHSGSISVSERTPRRADELVKLAYAFFSQSELPFEIAVLKNYGISSAHKLAAWVLEETDPIASAEHVRRAQMLFPKL